MNSWQLESKTTRLNSSSSKWVCYKSQKVGLWLRWHTFLFSRISSLWIFIVIFIEWQLWVGLSEFYWDIRNLSMESILYVWILLGCKKIKQGIHFVREAEQNYTKSLEKIWVQHTGFPRQDVGKQTIPWPVTTTALYKFENLDLNKSREWHIFLDSKFTWFHFVLTLLSTEAVDIDSAYLPKTTQWAQLQHHVSMVSERILWCFLH